MNSIVPSHSSPFSDDLIASCFDKKDLSRTDEIIPFNGTLSADICNKIAEFLPKEELSSVDKKIQQLFKSERKKREEAAYKKIRRANRTPEKVANDKIRRAKSYARQKEKDPGFLVRKNARERELRKKKKT